MSRGRMVRIFRTHRSGRKDAPSKKSFCHFSFIKSVLTNTAELVDEGDFGRNYATRTSDHRGAGTDDRTETGAVSRTDSAVQALAM